MRGWLTGSLGACLQRRSLRRQGRLARFGPRECSCDESQASPTNRPPSGISPNTGQIICMRRRVQRWNQDGLLEHLMEPVARQARRSRAHSWATCSAPRPLVSSASGAILSPPRCAPRRLRDTPRMCCAPPACSAATQPSPAARTRSLPDCLQKPAHRSPPSTRKQQSRSPAQSSRPVTRRKHPLGGSTASTESWKRAVSRVAFWSLRLYQAINPTKCGCGYKDRTTTASLSISWSRLLGKPVDGLRR
jgi:hypothetical protein